MPDFGFKAKPITFACAEPLDYSVPDFGFKAKQEILERKLNRIIACLILDSRQNRAIATLTAEDIIACLILDSRQNVRLFPCLDVVIIACLILDSRQNLASSACRQAYYSVPDFGFKAKHIPRVRHERAIIACLILDSRQNDWKNGKPDKQIIACLILDSRQNCNEWLDEADLIIACLILDSRQNFEHQATVHMAIIACLILDSRQNRYMNMRGVTRIIACLILDSRQNKALHILLILHRFSSISLQKAHKYSIICIHIAVSYHTAPYFSINHFSHPFGFDSVGCGKWIEYWIFDAECANFRGKAAWKLLSRVRAHV